MRNDRPWPLLAVAAGLLLAGAGSAWGQLRDRELSYALAAAGLILLGVWIAREIIVFADRRGLPPAGAGRIPPSGDGITPAGDNGATDRRGTGTAPRNLPRDGT